MTSNGYQKAEKEARKQTVSRREWWQIAPNVARLVRKMPDDRDRMIRLVDEYRLRKPRADALYVEFKHIRNIASWWHAGFAATMIAAGAFGIPKSYCKVLLFISAFLHVIFLIVAHDRLTLIDGNLNDEMELMRELNDCAKQRGFEPPPIPQLRFVPIFFWLTFGLGMFHFVLGLTVV